MATVAALTELAAPWPGDVVVEIVLLPPQLDVPAAHGDVVEEDVAAGMSAHRGHRLIQQEPGSGVGARSRTISAEPAGSPVGSGSTSGRFEPRVLFRWAKLHAVFVCPVAKPGPDLWRMARDARSFELGPLLAARRVGARRFPGSPVRALPTDMSGVGCRSMNRDKDWDGRPLYYDRQGQPMTMHQWAEKFEDENYTHIARDVIGPDEPLDPAPLITVSTVWRGLPAKRSCCR